MNNHLFSGVCTALVTPFINNKINYPLLKRLLTRQIDAGIQAVVLCGTTGESATLTDSEKIEMIRIGKDYVKDSCMIIAGTGSNSTQHAIELSIRAQEAGADALLIVSPYYNKATPDGLWAHYLSIARCVSIPIILYNVPSRTGVDIPISVYSRLSTIPNIAGVKEATTDITKITKIKNACRKEFTIWSGNDDMTVPIISLGGSGVISVLSNIYPFEMRTMCEAALDGDFDTAAEIQHKLQPLSDLMFSEVNPIPVKEAMRQIGFDCGHCRLPLCDATEQTKESIKNILAE